MPEQVKIGTDTNEMWFTVLAIVLEKHRSGKKVGNTTGVLEVCLTVDGVEVPFADTVKTLHERINATVNKRAASIARDIVEERLQSIQLLLKHIQRLDQELCSRMLEGFGVNITEDSDSGG